MDCRRGEYIKRAKTLDTFRSGASSTALSNGHMIVLLLLSWSNVAQAQITHPPVIFVGPYAGDSRNGSSYRLQLQYTTVAATYGAASASATWDAVMDVNQPNATCCRNDNDGQTQYGAWIDVYMRGSSGTHFALSGTATGSARASSVSGCFIGASILDADVNAMPGQSSSQVGTPNSLNIVDGQTSNETVTLPDGTVYSKASELRIGGGTTPSIGASINGPAVCHAEYHGVMSLVANILQSNKTPPTSKILPPVPASPTAGTAVTLDGSHSYDDDGDSIIQYEWVIQNSAGGTDTSSMPNLQYTWSKKGSYLVTLRVTDSDGQSGIASIPITVGDDCPLPDGIFNVAAGWVSGRPTDLAYTTADFVIGLAAQVDLSGRNIKETDAGGSIDFCYFSGASVGPIGLAQGVWGILPNNALSPPLDEFGLAEDQVDAYRRDRRAHGLSVPCQVILHQQMTISCPDGSMRPFGPVNRLIYTIGLSSVSAQRDGINGTGIVISKRYITP